MKAPLRISFAASAVALALGAVILIVGRDNQRKNAGNLRLQQAPINRYTWIGSDDPPNTISHRPKLLLDLAYASLKNEKIRALLKKHGYMVTTPTPAPSLPE